MSASMYDYIRTIVPEERLLFHEPMSRHTTFRVGGEAECMAVVETKEELSQLISYLGRIEQDYLFWETAAIFWWEIKATAES